MAGSPRRWRISAEPLRWSMSPAFKGMRSLAYGEATVEASLCLENMSAPATKRLRKCGVASDQ